MADPRYTMPVAGMAGEQLAKVLRKSIAGVEKRFPPKTGVCVFVFDFGMISSGSDPSNALLTMVAGVLLAELRSHQGRDQRKGGSRPSSCLLRSNRTAVASTPGPTA